MNIMNNSLNGRISQLLGLWVPIGISETYPCFSTEKLQPQIRGKAADPPSLLAICGPHSHSFVCTLMIHKVNTKLFRIHAMGTETGMYMDILGHVSMHMAPGEQENSWMMLDVHPHHRCWSILIIFPYPHFLLAVSIAGHDFSLNQFQYQWSDLVSTL